MSGLRCPTQEFGRQDRPFPQAGVLLMEPSERSVLIEKYAAGPAELRAAFDEAPSDAEKWKPSDGDWSIHEIIIHCADSETYAAIRIRLLAAEPRPLIVGYDQERWARMFNYHDRSLELSFSVIESVRGSTAELIASFDNSIWSATGEHTESGSYSAEDWLRTYGAHLHDHATQVRSNLERWNSQ